MTRWMPSPIAVITMRTESTRKGMSSVTIWTTVCADCQPYAARSGLNTWTLAVPSARTSPSRRWASAAPSRSRGSRALQVE